MVRTIKRTPGFWERQYGDITPLQLEECLGRIRNGELSQVEAARIYPISLRTIAKKLNRKHRKTVVHGVYLLRKENQHFLDVLFS